MSLASRTSSKTVFEVLGLGLESQALGLSLGSKIILEIFSF